MDNKINSTLDTEWFFVYQIVFISFSKSSTSNVIYLACKKSPFLRVGCTDIDIYMSLRDLILL